MLNTTLGADSFDDIKMWASVTFDNNSAGTSGWEGVLRDFINVFGVIWSSWGDHTGDNNRPYFFLSYSLAPFIELVDGSKNT